MFKYVRGAGAAPKMPKRSKHTLREEVGLKVVRLASALHRWKALGERTRMKLFAGG